MNSIMKKLNPKLALIFGIILLVLSGFLFWKSSQPAITAEDTIRCEQLVQQKYGQDTDAQFLEMCKNSVGWIAQLDAEANGATSAEDLAKAISSANQSEVGGSMFYMFFVGILLIVGLVLTITGFKGLAQNKP